MDQSAKSRMIENVIRKNYPNSFLPWTKAEQEMIEESYQMFVEDGEGKLSDLVKMLAVELRRNPKSIQDKINKLAPQKPQPRQKQPVTVDPVKVDYRDNPEAQEVLSALEKSDHHVFLTGRAGTGKSTLLNYFRLNTRKRLVVLAPTGVAAVNVNGQTIHSFCKFPAEVKDSHIKKIEPGSEQAQLLKKLDIIIIDEISMVRADLLDFLDKYLRLNGKDPRRVFGGYKMIFIGDLYQLPPVEKDFEKEQVLFKKYESPYFFHAESYQSTRFHYYELQKTYRQRDPVFIDILNGVRNNQLSSDHLRLLNARVVDDGQEYESGDFAIYLTTTNARAFDYNQYFLNRLTTKSKSYQASIGGAFSDRQSPVDKVLTLKAGAQVMMANNDRQMRWVNGTMGTVKRILEQTDERPEMLMVELSNGTTEFVTPHTWEMINYVYDEDTESVQKDVIGTFTQFPVRLAWAITIHKSQGKTFDNAYIDLSQGTFAHGQLYVALSRCKSLKGVHLNRPVHPKHIVLDSRVLSFLHRITPKPQEKDGLLD